MAYHVCIFICIIERMLFTWHESKRQPNLKKHGLDFEDGESVFNGPTSTLEDKREYRREQRFNTAGLPGMLVVESLWPL